MFARRDVLKGLAGMPLAGLPFAHAPARGAPAGLHEYTINTQSGRRVSGALAMPYGMPAPTLIVIHDEWGLNDQVKGIAADFARQGYLAVAVDLMDGRTAATPAEAQALTAAVVPEQATDTLAGWAEWLGVHDGSNRRLGTVGWGFGGTWSINASIATRVDATVVYYGPVTGTARELARLAGPVLGHFGARDRSVGKEFVAAWEAEMDIAGKPYATYWYDAGRGFADPAGGSYDEAAALLSWERTLSFLAKHL